MTTALVTFAEATVVEAEVIAAVSRTKARVAAQSAAFCGDQSSNVWFPVAPGATQPAAPAPTTNASPAPPNSVALPPGFDPTDTCYIFQDLLPLSTAPVYAEELEPTIILEPYSEIVPLLGITVASLSIREYPYELTLLGESIAAVTRTKLTIPTYIFGTNAGTFTTTGQAASLKRTFKVIGAAGTFTLTGAANGFLRDYVVAGAAGSIALAGQDAALVYQRNPFAAEVGAFLLEGQDTQFFYGKTLSADAGSFALSGEAAGLTRPERVVAGEAGTFALNGQAATVGAPSDPYFSSVSVLLHMNGSDTSTTITDSSSNAITVTAYGNAQISTAQSKFGGSSAYFDGNGDYLMTASSLTPLNMGTGDFTVEAFIRPTNNVSDYKGLIGISNSDTDTLYILGGAIVWYNSGTAAGTIAINNWYHVAASRQGSSLRVFINGTLVNTSTNSNNITFGRLRIGSNGANNSEWFHGWMDEVRITKGVARYTANFIAPSAPFPDS